MEDWQISELTPEQIRTTAKKAGKRVIRGFWVVFAFCAAIIVALFFVFGWRRVSMFVWDAPVDNGLLGTLGDFVGGVIGTLVAFYSIYLLVRTLEKQIESNAETQIVNKSVIETNQSATEINRSIIELDKLQLFDHKFDVFFERYKDAVAAYENGGKKGRSALEERVAAFVAQYFSNGLVYKKRVLVATRVFEEFYAENRHVCAVHFRGLYLLVRLVAEAKINEPDRVWYAKCIRGQLSEGELIILRYNCWTSNGAAMRRFVNHFNLLKHLSLMSLFEFRKWADLVPDKHERSALDAMLIRLKKQMREANDLSDDAIGTNIYEISSRYHIEITYCDNHTCMIFRLEENKRHKRGSGVKRPSIEKALDKIGTAELPEFFQSFLQEAFLTGNFYLFGNPPDSVHTPIPVEDSDDMFIFEIEVKGPKRLVLSEDQLRPS